MRLSREIGISFWSMCSKLIDSFSLIGVSNFSTWACMRVAKLNKTPNYRLDVVRKSAWELHQSALHSVHPKRRENFRFYSYFFFFSRNTYGVSNCSGAKCSHNESNNNRKKCTRECSDPNTYLVGDWQSLLRDMLDKQLDFLRRINASVATRRNFIDNDKFPTVLAFQIETWKVMWMTTLDAAFLFSWTAVDLRSFSHNWRAPISPAMCRSRQMTARDVESGVAIVKMLMRPKKKI